MSGKTGVITTGIATTDDFFPILRYALGSAIIIMVATGADYTLSYLTPVLALNFLAPGSRAPALKSSFAFLLTIALASLAGILFSRFFLDFPLVFLPLMILAIFYIYYTTHLQKMKVWLIISLLLIPMMAMQSAGLASAVAINLLLNAFLAILLVWIIYFIFPFKQSVVEETKAKVMEAQPEFQRYLSSLKKILVVMPVIVLFYVFNWSDALLVLIFIAILSMNPATSNKKAGIAIIAANLGGGLAAIIAYNLITIVPDILFFGMLVLLTGLLFGKGVFSRKPAATLYGMAFSTFLLILGDVISFTGDAGEKVWTRIFQLSIVVIYIVIAFRLVDHFSSSKKEITAIMN